MVPTRHQQSVPSEPLLRRRGIKNLLSTCNLTRFRLFLRILHIAYCKSIAGVSRLAKQAGNSRVVFPRTVPLFVQRIAHSRSTAGFRIFLSGSNKPGSQCYYFPMLFLGLTSRPPAPCSPAPLLLCSFISPSTSASSFH